MKTRNSKNMILIVLLLIISSFYSLIYFNNSEVIYSTGDLSFHLSRIKGLSSIFSGPINFTTFNNYGSAVNFFYPYLTIFPAVILYKLTNNLILSYVIFIGILNVATSIVTYYYGRLFFKKNDVAFVFSCLYTFAGYRTVDIYYRSAIAEAIAITIIPVVLYYAYQIILKQRNHSIGLAISMSLLVYTHVLSTLMCSLVIGFFIVGQWCHATFNRTEIMKLCQRVLRAVVMTTALTSFFWYPMFRQSLYQEVNKPFTTNLQLEAYSVYDSIQGAINNDLTTYTMGVVGVLSLILPLFILKQMNTQEKIIFYINIITWIVTTSLFPWVLLQKTPVHLLQFPWRLLSIQVLFSSLTLANLFMRKTSGSEIKKVVSVSIVVLLLVLSVSSKLDYSKKIQSKHGSIELSGKSLGYYTSLGTGGLYDYAPIAALKYSDHFANHEVKIDSNWTSTTSKYTNTTATFILDNVEDSDIILPVYSYWGTYMRVNEEPVAHANSEGLIRVTGQSGQNKIEVYTKYPISMIVTFAVSLFSYIILITIQIRKYVKIRLSKSVEKNVGKEI